jgi:hypothetical protein
MSAKGWLGGVLALVVVVGACGNHSETATGTATRPATAAAPVPAGPARCYGDPARPYTGDIGCVPGELVTVAQVLDAATMTLTDGRRVRLAGVIVPAATSCAGPAAIAATRHHVQNLQVNLHTVPGSPHDEFGNAWVYLQVGDYYGTDLGNDLTSNGWATEYQRSPANGEYLGAIASAEQIARDLHSGQFGPPCGPPAPSYDNPPADSGPSDTDVHVDVDHHRHHNMPDGALTGGFCRKHWWC